MRISTVIAIYFLIWWVTLFAVLPFGIRSQHEGEDYAQGTDPGAPMSARIGLKLVWTTVIASAIFGILFVVYAFRLVDFDAVLTLFGPRG
jgi:predicted secreted protein